MSSVTLQSSVHVPSSGGSIGRRMMVLLLVVSLVVLLMGRARSRKQVVHRLPLHGAMICDWSWSVSIRSRGMLQCGGPKFELGAHVL